MHCLQRNRERCFVGTVISFVLQIQIYRHILFILQKTEAVQNVLPTTESVDVALSAPVLNPSADSAPAAVQPITEQVAETPVAALDVLQAVGAEASLSELGLGSYTPVGLIQNLLELMHVSIGLPWWGAIVAGKNVL